MIDPCGKIPVKYEKIQRYGPQARLTPRKLFLYVIAFLMAILIYIQLEKELTKGYQEELFNKNVLNITSKAKSKAKDCINARAIDSKSRKTMEQVFSYFNSQRKINYHLCFSSLFFTVKSNQYETFRSSDGVGFHEQNEQSRLVNSEKCIESDAECEVVDVKFWKLFKNCKFKIHLCLLNEHNFNVCELLVDRYNTQAATNTHKLTCNYNAWTGEYILDINKQIKIVLHEYVTTLKTSSQLSYWNLQNYFTGASIRNGDLNSGEDLNDKAALKQGFMGYFFASEYLKVPLHFFYSQESRQKSRFLYTNYMDAAVRLPSDVINYFMIFYSDSWYI